MQKSTVDALKLLQTERHYHFKLEDFEGWKAQVVYPQLVVWEGAGRSIAFCTEVEYPVEVVHHLKNAEFCGYRESFLQWGIDLVAMVLHQADVLEIQLTHPKSGIKNLFVYKEQPNPIEYFGLKFNHSLTMDSFLFYPRSLERHPFTNLLDSHRPGIYYAWENQQDRYKQCAPADYVVISANTEGLLTLAELFLNFGRMENETDEINLETALHGGIPGASLGSIESRFWLPGSFLFYNDSLDTFNP
jgi:hypothetical protein